MDLSVDALGSNLLLIGILFVFCICCLCALFVSGYFWIGVIILGVILGVIIYQNYIRKSKYHGSGYGYDSTDSIFTESSL